MKFKVFLIILCVISNLCVAQQNEAAEKIKSEKIKKVAFTIDDVPFAGTNTTSIDAIIESNKKLLTTLKVNKVPAIGFVNEKIIFDFPKEIDQRIAILQQWLNEGFELGNHTYSHWSLSEVPLDQYEADVIKNERVTKALMMKKNMKLRYFRHPYLIRGSSLENKRKFEKFLSDRGYSVAPVTIILLDWNFNWIYTEAKNKNDKSTMDRVIKDYLDFIKRKIDFYDNASQTILGYSVPQVLLIHDNVLNADVLQEIIQIFKNKEYQFISLEEALKDKAYQLPDKYYRPEEGNWLENWGQTLSKKFDWRSDPRPSQFILEQLKKIQNAYKHYNTSSKP